MFWELGFFSGIRHHSCHTNTYLECEAVQRTTIYRGLGIFSLESLILIMTALNYSVLLPRRPHQGPTHFLNLVNAKPQTQSLPQTLNSKTPTPLNPNSLNPNSRNPKTPKPLNPKPPQKLLRTLPRRADQEFEAAPGLKAGLLVAWRFWVVISRVISPLVWVIIIVTLLITPLISTHGPPSRGLRAL